MIASGSAAVHKELFEQNGLAALLYDLLEFRVTRNLVKS